MNTDKPKKNRSVRRLITRLSVLLLAALFASQVFPWLREIIEMSESSEKPLFKGLQKILLRDYSVILPGLSPFLGISSAIAVAAAKTVSVLVFLCIPVLLLALFRGRWFCRHMCPTGLVSEYAGKAGKQSKQAFLKFPQLGPWLVAITLGGAVIGYPVFLWLDPLSIFNGFVSVWHKPLTIAGLVPAAGLLFIIVLSICRPNMWCYRICPLGASQDLLFSLVRASRRKEKAHASDGRRFFMGAAAGGVVAFIARKVSRPRDVIRPPGAVPEDSFSGLCTRCGNCVRACPEKVLSHDFGETGIAGLLTPVLTIGKTNYCYEICNECTKVCPTGAITRMTLREKNTISIGTAEIYKEKCLAWENKELCIVCDEYCPFHAIDVVEEDDVPCPVVKPDVCRGCGLCQTACPADPEPAIVIKGKPQRRLAPVDLSHLM